MVQKLGYFKGGWNLKSLMEGGRPCEDDIGKTQESVSRWNQPTDDLGIWFFLVVFFGQKLGDRW